MNVVGKIGEFIIEYQYPIEIALLSVLAVIILYALIKAIVKNKREKNVLSQINNTVSDINNTVSSINDKHAARMEKENGKFSNNISVSKDIPSVKVSYVVSDDECDHQTTVSIDHGYKADSIDRDDARMSCDAEADSSEAKEGRQDISVYDGLKCRDSEEDIETLIRENGSTETVKEDISAHREKMEAPKVFVSRECAIDKFGKIYTEEELSEQIK